MICITTNVNGNCSWKVSDLVYIEIIGKLGGEMASRRETASVAAGGARGTVLL